MFYKNLSSEQAEKLQQKFGKNLLPSKKNHSLLKLFLRQFINPLVYVLLCVGLISLAMGKQQELVFIFIVVFVNALIGFFQEKKTEKTLELLNGLIHPEARVQRDNQRQRILAEDIVHGDIVCVSSGEKVPADGVLLQAAGVFINEAILTGESEVVSKNKGDKVFMGTIVMHGNAVLKVEKIGAKTRIGIIAKSLSDTAQPLTTLQIRLKKLSKILIYLSLFLCLGIFLFGLLRGHGFLQMVELSAVLMIAVIPEALLLVVTLILVLAMKSSLKKNALIRKVFSIETLGSVTMICTDKTGTLTEGKMKVTETNFFDQQRGHLVMNLCNNLADSLEVALWSYLEKKTGANPQDKFDYYERVGELTFDSRKKYMAVLVRSLKNPAEDLILVKGAPEAILKMVNLSAQEQARINQQIKLWANNGLKVLALASAERKAEKDAENLQESELNNLGWEGLVGLWDPPREGVKESLEEAQRAGLKVKVITGDHYRTAEKIMIFLGFEVKSSEILTGDQLKAIKDAELKRKIDKIKLFARVTPSQKLRIVSLLQAQGEIVAMTGDGVNDAPALKKSNIGIVVGDATEVAKETADLILMDNNFKTIISAVGAGRLVFENIKKIIFYILSNSFAEVVVIFGALLLGWPIPLTIVQLLWLHLLCDGPDDFILGFEKKEKETLSDGPKRMDEPILDKIEIILIFIISSISGFFTLLFYWYFGLRENNLMLGQTMVFMSLAFTSIIYIFSCRTLRKPFWRYENFWSNPWLFIVVIFSAFLAFLITHWTVTQNLLGLAPLGLIHWLLIIGKGLLIILIIEIAKHFWGHKWSGGSCGNLCYNNKIK